MAPINFKLLSAKLALTSSVLFLKLASKKRKQRRFWVRKYLQRRKERGLNSFLRKELLVEDEVNYKNFIRMDENDFQKLLNLVRPAIKKKDTVMRECVPAEERLSATLRFLATGETYKSMFFSTRLSQSFLSVNVPIICKEIYKALKDDYLKFPSDVKDWQKIAESFSARRQFPLCLGALDGKHVTFRARREDGSYYRNYKNSDSIVLLALADANYKFIFIDVGCNGRVSDGGVLKASALDTILTNAEQHFPANANIGDNRSLPYVFIGDDAFPLTQNLMKPYPFKTQCKVKKVFNYRLSRARRCVEHAFGILVNRFRVLLNPMHLLVENVEIVTLAACALHNFLASTSTLYKQSLQEEVEPCPLKSLAPNNTRYKNSAANIRNEFAEYFVNEGQIDWQYK